MPARVWKCDGCAVAFQRGEPFHQSRVKFGNFHKHCMPETVDELIQLMRTCTLAAVRIELERLQKKNPELFTEICALYLRASTR